MLNLFQNQHGLNIVGQGGKIILFFLPSLVAAILIHLRFPQVASLPSSFSILRPVGYLLLVPGLILWASAVFQLLLGFPQGKLVTTGAYGVVRNPIYSSVALFILPAVSFITLNWVYFVVSFFLYLGVQMFIGPEEKQLTQVFGKKYQDYCSHVDRFLPFFK